MTDKLTINNCMVGSVVNYITAEGDTLPSRLDLQDLKWLIEDHEGFNACHYKAPITTEVLEKCPLPKVDALTLVKMRHKDGYDAYGLLYYPEHVAAWHGIYISDLQLYFRSLGLEWDLTKLFE